MLDTIAEKWAVDRVALTDPQRLHGGEESAAYRLGPHVARIGPEWRTNAEAEWCHTVALAAAEQVPEAIAPRRTVDGVTVVRCDGRPLSLWPFVEGAWGDKSDEGQRRQAAELLARVHMALRSARTSVSHRPPSTISWDTADETVDADLDAWLVDFDGGGWQVQPLHGDFYRGNVLVSSGRIVGLLDWDEAFIGPPERELAWAAWEWTGDLDLTGVRQFVRQYLDAGGPARPMDDVMLRQLIRQRLRNDVSYAAGATGRGTALDEADREYHARQIESFWHLRP